MLLSCALFFASLSSVHGGDWSTCTALDSRCPYRCGDGICESVRGETPCLCPRDCRGCCEDGTCRPDMGETHINCPKDCGAAIKGQVVNALSRAPLSGVLVRCVSPTNPNTVFGPLFTGVSGEFSFDRLPAGLYKCSAEISGQNSVFFESDLSPQNCTQRVILVPFPMAEGAITGELINCYTGERISGLSVSCSSGPTTSVAKISDAVGIFFVENLAPALYTCTAQGSGYRVTQRSLAVLPRTNTLRLYVCPLNGNLTGRVSDCKNDTAVRNAIVSCRAMYAPSFFTTMSTTTDVNGTYSLFGLPPGPIACTYSAATYISRTFVNQIPVNGVARINHVICEPEFLLRGIVREFTICHARGIPNVLVTCTSNSDVGVTRTANDGSFSLSLKAGSYLCSVVKTGYISETLWAAEVGVGCQRPVLLINMNPVWGSIGGRAHARFYPAIPVVNSTITCFLNPRNLDGSPDWGDDRCAPRIRTAVTDEQGNWLITENQRNGPFVCNTGPVGIYRQTTVHGATNPGGFARVDFQVDWNPATPPPKLSSQP